MSLKVILPVPIDRAFEYATLHGREERSIEIGSRVVVPFGARSLTGIVVGRGKSERELKSIIEILDDRPALTPELLKLTRWIADYYQTSWGMAVKAALPTGTDVATTRRIRLKNMPADGGDSATRPILAVLKDHPDVALSHLNRLLGGGVPITVLRKLEAQGLIAIEDAMTTPRVQIRTRPYIRLSDVAANDPAAGDQLRGEKQRNLLATLRHLHKNGRVEIEKKELLELSGASAASLKGLSDRKLVEIADREVVRTPFGMVDVSASKPEHPDLHPAQKAAIDAIDAATSKGEFRTFLLHGITGSGKTHVYIEALKSVIDRGQTGIVLVPEIALTPQTVRRFRSHLGDRIAVMHSRMSLGERFDAWRKLRDGAYSVVIGPRSAVLAPLENVGLIVVDEEHETSYKQFDPAPRYHARDVAVMRALQGRAVCVLGSATPSLESYHNALVGKYTLLHMPDRVPTGTGKPAELPKVHRVNLSVEQGKRQLDGSFSWKLRDAIQERLDRKEQIMLLQNRRGYAPIVECQGCGWTPQCRDCAVSLTHHRKDNHTRCHYCGYTVPMPKKCPTCNESTFALLGAGTQRIEAELEALFPDAVTLRMDLDTTSTKDAHFHILRQFGEGAADILVGTQMIAKGLDFPNVTLVGIINADTRLLMPDFRAAEHTFHLLTQVAGRAGRADKRGDVILQTRNPRHEVIQRAGKHDFIGFAERELEERRALNYPPFGRIIAIEFKGPEEKDVDAVATSWTELFEAGLPDGVSVLGPEVAFIARIKRNYRFQTILKLAPGVDPARVKEAVSRTMAKMGSTGKTRIVVDVDPVNLL